MKGKSLDTALCQVVKVAEIGIYHKHFVLAAFLAFKNITSDSIKDAIIALDDYLTRWIISMLNSRVVFRALVAISKHFG